VPPRLRFAPSPTGYLHVGGARTALFNWLYVRRHGGTFILRIEDTDVERSSTDMVTGILHSLRWLGLDWDEGPDAGGPHAPYFQSERRDRYQAAANRLVASGHAYYCYCRPEDLKAKREAAEAAGHSWTYDRACRSLTAADVASREAAKAPRAIRFKVVEGRTSFIDLVHGAIEVDHATIEDFVVLRSDGHPTYHLSVVVDDVEMAITHVVRGDDHISNTPKQILLYRAMGAAEPAFAHVPLILGPDKKRLSKRHGATSVGEYEKDGILPEAMVNFLALLGWSPGGDLEVLSREDLVRLFSFEGIGKAGAVFDLQKLGWLSGQYIAKASAEELAPRLRTFFEKAGLWDRAFEGEKKAWFIALVELFRPRCRTYVDFVEAMRPFLTDDFAYEEEAARKHFKDPEVLERLRSLRGALAAVSDWADGAIEAATRRLAESLGLSAGKLIHPARLALTGRGVSPGLFEVMVALGRNRTLARLDRAIAHVGQSTVH
jgi:glutamyl-tRNA synthetase